MTGPGLDERRVEQFERALLFGTAVRLGERDIWQVLARVFPNRAPGSAERRLLLDALKAVEARGSIRLPSERGKRWDRSMYPAVPNSVDIVRARATPVGVPRRTFPWHSSLSWVVYCRTLSGKQMEFLRSVHDGLVNGKFDEPAPLKYRSLQLTGDEKMLASLAKTSLFGPSRLTFEILGCLPDANPLAWEAIGMGGRLVIFENAGPFAVARRVLGEMKERPYDLVAFGGGSGILGALGHLKTIGRDVESMRYVGDLDHAGLDIARSAQRLAGELGLPDIIPASELHRQMLSSAESFGRPRGWPAREHFSEGERARLLEILAPDVRDRVEVILKMGRRIPEEVLGPDELRRAWEAHA